MSPLVRERKQYLTGNVLNTERSRQIQREYDNGLEIIDDTYRAPAAIFHDPALTREEESGCSFMQIKGSILIDLGTFPSRLRKELLFTEEHCSMIRTLCLSEQRELWRYSFLILQNAFVAAPRRISRWMLWMNSPLYL